MRIIAAPVIACVMAAAPAMASPLITVHAQREPLSQFVREVSRQAKIELRLAKDLSEEKISARMTQVTVGDVLDVLKNFKGVDAYKTESGYALVRRRRPAMKVTQADSQRRPS